MNRREVLKAMGATVLAAATPAVALAEPLKQRWYMHGSYRGSVTLTGLKFIQSKMDLGSWFSIEREFDDHIECFRAQVTGFVLHPNQDLIDVQFEYTENRLQWEGGDHVSISERDRSGSRNRVELSRAASVGQEANRQAEVTLRDRRFEINVTPDESLPQRLNTRPGR